MKQYFALLFLFLSPLFAQGQKTLAGNTIIVSEAVNGNLYISAGSITINAPVRGDLVVAGGTVIINDSVTDDIMAIGGTITINGYTGGDVRTGGGEIFIKKNIGGDLVIGGGRIHIENGATINGGLLAGSGEIEMNGIVKGDMKAGSGTFKMNGTAMHNMDCRAGDIFINGTINGNAVLAAQNINIGPTAAFQQNVRYWSRSKQLAFGNTIKNGEAIYDPNLEIKSGRWAYIGSSTVLGLLWYLGTVFIFILLVQYFFGKTIADAGAIAFAKSLKSVGYGLLFIVLVPIGVVLMMVTIVGIPLAILIVILYAMLLLLANIITSSVITSWINSRSNKKWGFWPFAFANLGIFIVYRLVTITPFFGPTIMFIVTCMAFGAILINVRMRGKRPLATI
ncbi:MAG: polymer-forming cytoskeletal protein [Bacteroidetes bacterium]|nr:polymer-forming cytoskeletal protein [Bacteroidota bacterium]